MNTNINSIYLQKLPLPLPQLQVKPQPQLRVKQQPQLKNQLLVLFKHVQALHLLIFENGFSIHFE